MFGRKSLVVIGAFAETVRAIMAQLADEGADIAVADTCRADDSRMLVESIGRRFLGVRCDISDLGQARAFAAQVHEAFGAVDIVIGDTSSAHVVKFQQWILERWPRTPSANFGHFLLVPEVFLEDLQQSAAGRLLELSLCSDHRASHAYVAHLVRGRGTEGISYALATNAEVYNVTVNKIASFIIRAPSSRGSRLNQVYLGRRLKLQSFNEPLSVEDVAKFVVLLASDEADFITGQRIGMDIGSMGGGSKARIFNKMDIMVPVVVARTPLF